MMEEDSKTANPAARLRVLSMWRDLVKSSVLKELVIGYLTHLQGCAPLATHPITTRQSCKINANLLSGAGKLAGTESSSSSVPFTLHKQPLVVVNPHVAEVLQ